MDDQRERRPAGSSHAKRESPDDDPRSHLPPGECSRGCLVKRGGRHGTAASSLDSGTNGDKHQALDFRADDGAARATSCAGAMGTCACDGPPPGWHRRNAASGESKATETYRSSPPQSDLSFTRQLRQRRPLPDRRLNITSRTAVEVLTANGTCSTREHPRVKPAFALEAVHFPKAARSPPRKSGSPATCADPAGASGRRRAPARCSARDGIDPPDARQAGGTWRTRP